MKLLIIAILMLLSTHSQSHGITSASAHIAVRPGHLIELQIQFNFIDLLNHKSNDYSLPIIAALSEQKFGLLYKAVITLFNQKLIIKKAGNTLSLNKRLPTQKQVFALIKRQFVESRFIKDKKNTPYTFSDRRFYQVFYFDFLLNAPTDLDQLSISFPQQLGTVYVTLTESSNQAIHQGDVWTH